MTQRSAFAFALATVAAACAFTVQAQDLSLIHI